MYILVGGVERASLSAFRFTQSKKTELFTIEFCFPGHPENKDPLLLLSDKQMKIKTASQQKEECVAAAAPRPPRSSSSKGFLLLGLSWKPVKEL